MEKYKRVLIWDMDWHERNSFVPKPDAMKVASFHKQQGSIIYFLEDAEELEFDYDLIYVFRDIKNTGFPPLRILDSPRTRLCGDEFVYYDSYWEPDMAIAMTRPSYSLYPLSDKNIYKGAHVIQLLYKGTYLLNKQDFTNFTKQPRQKALVVDKDLWSAEDDVILAALSELKGLNNIEFKYPISLKRLLDTPAIGAVFLHLNFIGGTNMPFKNDLGNTFQDAKRIIDFLKSFRKIHNVKLKPIQFKSVIYDHYEDTKNGIKDLERILKIITYAKKQKIYVEAISPERRLITPYWAFFELLEGWTKYDQYTSYIHAMLHSTIKRTKQEWYEILNDPQKWMTPRVWFLLHIWTKYPHIIAKYGAVIWGENELDLSLVNTDQIIKSVNIGEREDVLEKIQNEIMGGE